MPKNNNSSDNQMSNNSQSPAKKKNRINKHSSSNRYLTLSQKHSSRYPQHTLSPFLLSQTPQASSSLVMQQDDDEEFEDEDDVNVNNDDETSVKSNYNGITKSSLLPYCDGDPSLVQLELIEISLLIHLAKECQYDITTQATQQQFRQRADFITTYNQCQEQYGYKHKVREALLVHSFNYDILPVLYLEQTSTSTTTIREDDIILGSNEAKVTAEISNTYTIAQVTIDQLAPGYKHHLTNQLNNKVSASTATTNSNNEISCALLTISLTSSNITLTPTNNHGCNQILAMVIAQGKASGETIEADINNKTTINKIITFCKNVTDEMQSLGLTTESNDFKAYVATMNKFVNIQQELQQHLNELENTMSSSYSVTSLEGKCTFSLIHIQQLLRGASNFLLFRFYKNESTHNRTYSLISSNELGLRNSKYHTLDQVSRALELGIVCCLRSSTGNELGEMTVGRKDTTTQAKIQAIKQKLHSSTTRNINKLPILCPNMMHQRNTKTQEATELTIALSSPATYDVVHISGIPSNLYDDKPNLQAFLICHEGVLHQLHIPNPHLIQMKRQGTEGYESLTLDIRQSPYQYTSGTKSIVIKLLSQYTHHLSTRAITAKIIINNQTIFLTVICHFMTQQQADILQNGTEVAALRPLSPQFVSQQTQIVKTHYQNKTLTNLLVLPVGIISKLLQNSNKIISVNTTAVIILAIVNEENLMDLKKTLLVPNTCTYNSNVLCSETLRLQIANNSKHFAFLNYPDSMQGDPTIKYLTVSGVPINASAHTVLTEVQKNAAYGHCIKYIYNFPITPHTMDLVIAVSLEKIHHNEMIQIITNTLTKLRMFSESETSIIATSTHPGKPPTITLKGKPIVHPTSTQTSWITSTPTKNMKTDSSSKNKSDRNNYPSQSPTIADYFKPQSHTSTTSSTHHQE